MSWPQLSVVDAERVQAMHAQVEALFQGDPEAEAALQNAISRERVFREARRRVDAEERPPVAFPEILTLRQRLAAPPDPVKWRVEGWLPAGGRAVLAAQAKAGKTHLAANLVRNLADGTPFLGRDPVARVTGKVAVFDFEMTERQLYEWYSDLGIVADDRILVFGLRGQGAAFDLRDEGIRQRWAQVLLDEGVEFVVWDCLRPVIDALGLDENHDASALLTAFDAMLALAGGPDALVVHHMGHNSERARGDSGIIGWGDANWKLVLGPDGDEHGPRWLKANGRDVAQSETQLARDPETRHLTAVGGSRASAQHAAAGDAIIAFLKQSDEAQTAGRCEAAATTAPGVTRKAAREALGQLVALNQVVVEVGERNARLHRLNKVSSPVRHSSPQFASEVPRQFAAAYIGGEPASSSAGGLEEVDPRRGQEGSLPGLTEEQRALIEQARANSAGQATAPEQSGDDHA